MLTKEGVLKIRMHNLFAFTTLKHTPHVRAFKVGTLPANFYACERSDAIIHISTERPNNDDRKVDIRRMPTLRRSGIHNINRIHMTRNRTENSTHANKDDLAGWANTHITHF